MTVTLLASLPFAKFGFDEFLLQDVLLLHLHDLTLPLEFVLSSLSLVKALSKNRFSLDLVKGINFIEIILILVQILRIVAQLYEKILESSNC